MAMRDLSGDVDFDRLETYAGHDQAIVEEVLGLFDEQAAMWMRLLEGADPATARDAAHAMKGAALGIGADPLAAACGAMEAESDPALGPRRLAQVRDALARACVDLAAYRHELLIRGLRRSSPPAGLNPETAG